MRWDYGSVYKEIRQARNLSQKDVCGETITRSALSKFESNQTTPRYEHMAHLLQQINMGFDEFQYICNDYQLSERQGLWMEINQLVSQPKVANLSDLIARTEAYLQKEEDLQLALFLKRLKISAAIQEQGFTDQAYQLGNELWWDLEKLDNWYYNDFRLLNAILYIFPIDIIRDVADRIMEASERYADFKDLREVKISLFTNLATVLMHQGLLNDATKIAHKALALGKEAKRYDIIAVNQAHIGYCEGKEELVEAAKQILTLLGEEDLLTTITVEQNNLRAQKK